MKLHSQKEDNNYDIRNLEISYADKINITTFSRQKFDRLSVAIQTNSMFKSLIENIRSATSKDERQNLKRNTLPYFNMGVFEGNIRKNKNIIKTEFMIFDFDHITDLNNKKELLKNDPRVFCLFTSPSGDGLKVICRLEKAIRDAKEFSRVYKIHATELGISLGEKEDRTSDVSRACYISYDPDLYLNNNAVPLAVEAVDEKETAKKPSDREEVLTAISKGFVDGERTDNLQIFIGLLIDRGFDRDMALGLVRGWNQLNQPPLPQEKLKDTLESMFDQYSKNESLCENFYSFDSTVIKAGIVNEEFTTSKIGKEKFFLMQNLFDKTLRDKCYKYLVQNKHILQLKRMNYLATMDIEKSFYDFDYKNGEMNIHLAPVDGGVVDNDFIEHYLENVFREQKNFMKRWLAVYFHTNYRKLPMIILTGERGVGKNVFAESLVTIFPSLSRVTKELNGNFNPGAEKKLLIIDESTAEGKVQYTDLKKMSGQHYVEVNEKFEKKYQVKNNLNLIILSNEEIPISVNRDELPTDENNNQFFVFKMQKWFDTYDGELRKKLEERWVHYIRTELKTVLKGIDFNGYRYSIPTPITEEEKKLFDLNTTDLDFAVDEVVEDLMKDAMNVSGDLRKWVAEGVIPKKSIKKKYGYKDVTSPKVIAQLNSKGYLAGDGRKRQILGDRAECYKLGERFTKELEKLKTETPTSPIE